MNRIARPLLLAALALALATTPVLAVGPYFVELVGAVNQYDMGTVNDYLDSVNDEAGRQAFDHLDSGGSWGLYVGQVFERRLAVSVGYQRFHAKVESSPPPVMTIKAPANLIGLQLEYALFRLGPVIPFLQGHAGFIWNNGHLEYENDFGTTIRHDFSGSTISLGALAGAELRFAERFGLNLAVGYHLADISSPDWDASSFGGYGTFTGPGFDYGGLVLRAGLRIQLDWGEGEDAVLKETPRSPEESREPTGWM
jgi:hypothetical protein